jgi:ethanolaminephosphotransferase
MQARRARGERARVALLGLLPFFFQWALIASYLYFNPLILHQNLVPFVFFVGIVNAYSVGQMITAHLTKDSFPFTNVLNLPIALGVIDGLGPVFKEYLGFGWRNVLGHDVYQVSYMFMCLGLAIGVYGTFILDVIVTICDYLDIWCLTIKHPKVKGQDGKKSQ